MNHRLLIWISPNLDLTEIIPMLENLGFIGVITYKGSISMHNRYIMLNILDMSITIISMTISNVTPFLKANNYYVLRDDNKHEGVYNKIRLKLLIPKINYILNEA